ncbi:hypothetical protein [Lentzea sp. NPDC059081]|uniref:hypothetical protein n=1 Tax=Lentzea sp. NPDC059081 TaxID=3346719 RepID=UPI0036BF6991
MEVALGLQVDSVPDAVTTRLTRGTTADPAEDLIKLEGKFRSMVAALKARTNEAEHAVASARRELTDAGSRRGLAAWRRRRSTMSGLARAIKRQSEVSALLHDAIVLLDTLREFVIGLNAPAGLLRESADGWRLSPDVPATAVVFGPEDNFAAADPRRLETGRGIPGLAGEVYGEQWRRDGDDDGPYSRPLDRAGPWRLAYIARTGEIYASRRCGYLSQEVWLLGSGFEPERARDLLGGLLPRMREPNSLILAAGVVHACRPLRPAGDRVGLRRPANTSGSASDGENF